MILAVSGALLLAIGFAIGFSPEGPVAITAARVLIATGFPLLLAAIVQASADRRTLKWIVLLLILALYASIQIHPGFIICLILVWLAGLSCAALQSLNAEAQDWGERERARLEAQIGVEASLLEAARVEFLRQEEAFATLAERFEAVKSIGSSLRFEETWQEITRACARLLGTEPVLFLPQLGGAVPSGYLSVKRASAEPQVCASLEELGRPGRSASVTEGWEESWQAARLDERVVRFLEGEDKACWFPLELGNRTRVVLHFVTGRHVTDDLIEILAMQAGLALEKVRLFHMVELQSRTDILTNLPHHAQFKKLLGEELARSEKSGRSMSLLIADVDRFKRVNDTYGHLTGDQVLVHVAQTIRKTLRLSDTAARYGGEEFAVILPDTDREGAQLLAERLRALIEQKHCAARVPTGDLFLPVTISIGVAAFPDDAGEMMRLIERADEALYTAKRTGRNRVISATDPAVGQK